MSHLSVSPSRAGWHDIGGGIDNSGTLTVSNSTIDNNTASNGIIDFGGGGIFNVGTLTVSNSTIANNSATGSYGSGGGIDNDAGTLTVSNSTIANNSAVGTGGGIFTWFGSGTGSLTVTDSTIANNSATGSERRRHLQRAWHADGHQLHHRQQLGHRRRAAAASPAWLAR